MGDIIKGVAIGIGIVAAGVGIYKATNRVLEQYELDHAARREMKDLWSALIPLLRREDPVVAA